MQTELGEPPTLASCGRHALGERGAAQQRHLTRSVLAACGYDAWNLWMDDPVGGRHAEVIARRPLTRNGEQCPLEDAH